MIGDLIKKCYKRSPIVCILTIFICVWILIYTGFFLYHSFKIVFYPFDLDYGEGFVLRDAVNIIEGKPIYTDISEFPMVPSTYPPVFLLLNALLIPVFGKSFIVGRALSLFSSLIIIYLIFRFLYSSTKDLKMSLIFSCSFCASNYVYQWSAFNRVDVLAVLFSVAGIYFFFKYQTKGLYLSLFFCILAIYTKQTMLAAPIAISIVTFIHNRRLAAKFILIFVALGSLIFIISNYLTHGQFWQHLFIYNTNPYLWDRLFKYEARFLGLHIFFVLLALIYTINAFKKNKADLLPVYFITAYVATFTIGNIGSSTNYFIELIAISIILAGLAWNSIIKDARGNIKLVKIALSFGLFIQLLLFIHIPHTPLATRTAIWPPLGYTPVPKDIIHGNKINHYIRVSKGEILTEESGFAIQNEKEVLIHPLVLNYLERQGKWRADKLIEAIHLKKFSLIIISYYYYPKNVLYKIYENYEKIDEIFLRGGWRYEIFVPKK